eukprot:CAMPEP_0198687872 /NCGR_PEP_ID=MMETSP1468-20131203/80053_1 /TAXON_ID=1461545 /ORGANISM="Mantoniella sp, Strain CCMP1436" /LENGTH=66 /DNA_ID=CAMNT_0044436531 /DNA_START=63 /DNA_END=259 /DNA_ORIENTATION=+
MHSIRLHTGTDEPGLRVHTRGEAIVAKSSRPLRKLTLLDVYRRIPAPTSPAAPQLARRCPCARLVS